MRRNILLIFTVLSLQAIFVQQLQAQTPEAQYQTRFLAELNNIRALPFGYRAVCENDDLKLRSSSSATFVVRDSLLCGLKKTDINLQRREWFVLCSNRAEDEISGEIASIPKCADLEFELTEI